MATADVAAVKPARRGGWVLLLTATMLQLVVGVPYVFAFILAPGGVVVTLYLTWLVMTIPLFLGWRHGAGKVLLLAPRVTFMLWFGVLSAAQLILGRWTV